MAAREVCTTKKHVMVVAVAVTVYQLYVTVVEGNPCTCPLTQKCVTSNNTLGFTCVCSKKEYQLAANGMCVQIPDSQRLYLEARVEITDDLIETYIQNFENYTLTEISISFDAFSINTISYFPSIKQQNALSKCCHVLLHCSDDNKLEMHFNAMGIDSFIGVNISEISLGTLTDKIDGKIEFSLMFSEQITFRIREAVALVVLKLEKIGHVIVNNQTIYIKGQTGIFNTKDEITSGVDAIDWCSSPNLSQCPNQSTCNDTGIRYNCTCNKGYFENNTFCQPTIRLVNSSLTNQGRLEYYLNGAWNTVCKEGFKSREAGVVCRQIGYPSRGAQYFTNDTYISMTSSILNNDLNCTGKERFLSDCTLGERNVNCTHLDDISVACDGECPDNYHYGPNCTQFCNCPQNTTESCDRQNGTCYCNEGWEGVTCEKDVDECALKTGICIRAKEVCRNTLGGYDCVCASYAKRNATGTCVGVVDVSGPSPFRTDGSRSLTLTCLPGNVTENVNITWSVPCDTSNNRTCTFTPKPPRDDGKVVTCTVNYSDGQPSSNSFTLDLNYPPSLPPAIQGYNNGEELHVGNNLNMKCTVQGGKPSVKAVVFSCPSHPDRQQDVFENNQVESILTFDPLRSSDNDILCVCIAAWEDTDWYTQSATRRLIVNGTEQDTPIPVALIAGLTGGGGAGLVTVIVVIIVIWRHQRNKRYDRPNRDLVGVVYPYTNEDPYAYDDIDPYSEIKETTEAYSEGNLHNYLEILNDEGPQTNSNPLTDDPKPCYPALHTFITDSAKDHDMSLHPNYSSHNEDKVLEVDGYLYPIRGSSVEPGTGENQEGIDMYPENDLKNPETQRSDYLLAVNIHLNSKEKAININNAISLVTDNAIEATDVLDAGMEMSINNDEEEYGDPRTDYLLSGDAPAVDGDVDSFRTRLESSTNSKDDYLHPIQAQGDQITCPNETVEGNLKHDYLTPSSTQPTNGTNYTVGYNCKSPKSSKESSKKDYLHPDSTGIFHETNNETSYPFEKVKIRSKDPAKKIYIEPASIQLQQDANNDSDKTVPTRL